MKRPESSSPAPSPALANGGRGASSSPSALSGTPAGLSNATAALSSSLEELLRATDRTLPNIASGAPEYGGATRGAGGSTDLELLLLLQRQRHRISGVNSLFLQQHLLPQQHGEGALNFQTGNLLGLPSGSQSATGGNSDGPALLRQAEALLAMQQHRGRPGSSASLSAASTGSGAAATRNFAPSMLSPSSQYSQRQDQIPADISAVLQARLRRSQEQQQRAAAQQAFDVSNRLNNKVSSSSSGANTDKAESVSAVEEEGSNKSDESADDDSKDEGDSVGGGEATTGDGDIADFPVNDTFPYKLYRMLENSEKQGYENIVSFAKEGRAFIIHKANDFVAKIMPQYFTTTRMTSFQRQLNLYGFRRISEGPDKGAYSHKYFIKGRRKLCKKIKRKKNHPKPPPAFMAPSNHQSAQGLHGMLSGIGDQTADSLSLEGRVLSSMGLGLPGLPPSMLSLLHQQQQQQQQQEFPGYAGGLSPALLELRQRQQAQSDLVRLLLQQQQQDQLQRMQQHHDDTSKNSFRGFFPPNL